MIRFIAALVVGLWASSVAAQSCTEIRFAPGASSGSVSGQLSYNINPCYRFRSGAGQTARLKLDFGPHACFTVHDVVECQVEHSFITQARNYEVVLGTFDRSAGGPYTLHLSIR